MNMHCVGIPRVLAVVVLVAFATGAEAGSNLPDGYPVPMCGERPVEPERPEKFETEEAIAAYNARVDAFNASMEHIVACIREYVANAAEDIKLIQRRASEVVERMSR